MNWSAIDFDWNQVRAFLATLEEGSLSAAARALGLTQPTLGRQVTALEAELGITLFERAGRQLVPTPAALEMAEHVRQMAEAATKMSLVASGQSQSVEGRVKITATEMYSVFVLPEFVAEMQVSHPGILIEIVSTNSLSNLRQREADIAIRNAEPTDLDLIAKSLGGETGGMFATQAVIDRYGPFNSLSDLKDVPFVGFGANSEFLEALQKRQVPITESNIVAGSESHLVHWEMARQGLGLAVNGWKVGLKTGDMIPVCRDALTFDFPVWLVAPQELRTSRRVRIVFDALDEFLRKFAHDIPGPLNNSHSATKSA
ncbi:MAG: LysR family transcriptional regulator [Boseongicola sp.]|nr:LysR family transcriptional regulator [Boseongicola sp.]MDD9977704.1 LysR family transcriptional regulator [Boseongicola sp.]